MEIISDKKEMVFKNITKDNKVFYTLGLSKKNQDGSYAKGKIMCRFQKDINLESKTLIKINEGWLDFYLIKKSNGTKEWNETTPYIFINKFEVVDKVEEVKMDIQEDEFKLTDQDYEGYGF